MVLLGIGHNSTNVKKSILDFAFQSGATAYNQSGATAETAHWYILHFACMADC